MCGIAGIVGGTIGMAPERVAHVRRMVAQLAHRGPDGSGVWADPQGAACLGHRRLAIIDPSDAGHQPMVSPSGRYVISLNGEIYDHAALRAELRAEGREPAWRGASDTESLLAAIDAWGVDAAIERSTGMFALALWDRARHTLVLARDRIGEKPLYFGRLGDGWWFGSELKAPRAHPAFESTLDPVALAAFLNLGYVPAPATIYRGVRKLAPGRLLEIEARTGTLRERAYWSAAAVTAAEPLAFGSPHEATERLEELLIDAVRAQAVADRPVGMLLSGGVDSSCVAALLQAALASPVRTFSIGFRESGFDEARYARAVAEHLGTEHTELYVTPREAAEVLPLMPTIYDEPFADSSQIPTYLVSRLARREVVVALTGDGGDELFGGYPRYRMGQRLWRLMSLVPLTLRSASGLLLDRLAHPVIDRAFARALPQDDAGGLAGVRPADKLAKLGWAVRSDSVDTLYDRLLAPWAAPAVGSSAAVRASGAASRPAWPAQAADGGPWWGGPRAAPGAPRVEEAFMLRDLLSYLPDDILVKTDRAAMAVGLETRAPLLDRRVVEFALRLPLEYKLSGGTGKWLLRRVLHRHVPAALVERPKMGFTMPIAAWLRGPLKGWAADLIASRDLGPATEAIDRRVLARVFAEHCAGVRDHHQALWSMLMLLAWSGGHEAGANAVQGSSGSDLERPVADTPL